MFRAFTTDGGGWWFVCEGEDRDAVLDQATRIICGDQWGTAKDIYTDTRLKNLLILPRSQAQRRAALRRAYEAHLVSLVEDAEDA